MDGLKIKEKVTQWTGKYKYVALILLLGLCLMAIPGKKEAQDKAVSQQQAVQEETVEEQLARILAQIQGAGRVEVMLTEAVGEQTLYQSNEDTDTSQEARSVRRDTVIVTDENRAEAGLVQQVNPPQYLGALVVCQGADSPAVRLAIVEAVSKVTGLGANRISVLKMK